MSRLYSFPPIANSNAKILILGSMPGKASLDAVQYYAHPRNLFWPMMAEILGFDAALDYAQRTECLKSAGVALWDVLQSCHREGSLDTAIKNEMPNDFPAFLQEHPQIRAIFFNGEKAATSFKRSVQPCLALNELTYIRLPSTSPANASQTQAYKLTVWRQIAEYLG